MLNKWWFFILLLFMAIILRLLFLSREFVLEEALHVKVVRSLIDSGSPQIYLGEQEALNTFLDRPPSLFFLMVPFIFIFGESEISARLTPMLFSIFELILVFYFGSKFFKNSKAVPLLAAFLMATHPYLIQTSLQVHFDQVYSFFSTLFLFLCLDKIIHKKDQLKDFFQLGLAFFLMFAIKYDPSLIALSIVTIFAFFIRKKFLYKFLISVFFGASFFFLLLASYTFSIGSLERFWVPLNLIKKVLTDNFLPKFMSLDTPKISVHFWANNYYILIRFLSWLSIPVILLSIYSFIEIATTKKFINDLRVLFLSLWFFLYTGVYLLMGWAGDYPRYFAPAMPALFLLISFIVVNIVKENKQLLNFRVISICVLISLSLLFFAQTKGYLFLDHITGWIPSLQIPFFIILFLGCLIIFFLFKFKVISFFLLLILVYLTIGQFSLQYIHDLSSNFSLTNAYGVSGSKEAGRFLRNSFKNKNKVIYTYDPVAYYWGGRYFDHVNTFYGKILKEKEPLEILTQENISAYALPQIYFDDIESSLQKEGIDFKEYLSKNYPNYKKFGGILGTEVYYK